MLIEGEFEIVARLAAVRTENESESLHDSRLTADVESDCGPVRMKVILREAILAADVDRVIVARENES